MKQAIKETTLPDGSISKMTDELVPPEEHQRNMAKKSIQTFKDHFVGVLSGCAKTMPMHLWCQLLPQVERQLLLLRQSQVNPGMSAYAHVYQGQHNYSKHPFVPIGMESLVHVKPHKQWTYAKKVLSLAHCSNTTSVKRFGWRTCMAPIFQEQSGSSTNTWPTHQWPQKTALQQLVD